MRLFDVICIWPGSALTVIVYAGSNEPPNSMQMLCCSVTTMEVTGRPYRIDKCVESSVMNVYSLVT